jgi:Gpi18-like mannosyltransferase
MFKNKHFLISLFLFILLNSFLFVYILVFNKSVPLNRSQYDHAHHYLVDPRISSKSFDLLRGLDAWDAQWYVKIAELGYPKKQNKFQDGSPMGSLTYAFFPFYPFTLAVINYIVHNIELAALILVNLLLVANFFSIYFVVSKTYGSELAIRTIWLLFLFPFSIFYRSYYTEGLFLLLLVWFSYFLIKKRLFLASLFASFLFVTRPNGIVLGCILFYSLYRAVIFKKIHFWKSIIYALLSLLLFLTWLYYCYLNAGNPFFWNTIQSVWYKSPSIGITFLHNIETYLSFYSLPLHDQRASKIDTGMIVIVLLFLILGKKFLKPQLWWISFIIWLVPLLTRDTMSFTRYQIISFPLFIYLASLLKGVKFGIVSAAFLFLLFFVSVYFVNWHWIG